MGAYTFAFFLVGDYILLVPALIYGIFAVFLGYLYMKGMREVTRLEAMSKSPVLSFFSEIARGSVLIRSTINKKFIFSVIIIIFYLYIYYFRNISIISILI